MKAIREVVFDAADLHAESAFWAGILGGRVFEDDTWHSVIDADERRIGVQLASDHVPPDWPHGATPQQVHLDLHVDDPRAAHEEAIGSGARLLQAAADLVPTRATRCTPIPRATRSASAGDSRRRMRSRPSGPSTGEGDPEGPRIDRRGRRRTVSDQAFATAPDDSAPARA